MSCLKVSGEQLFCSIPVVLSLTYGNVRHAAFLPHGLRAEVDVTPGAVPVSGHGFGIEGRDHAEGFRYSVENVASHPQLVGHLKALARTNLELPL